MSMGIVLREMMDVSSMTKTSRHLPLAANYYLAPPGYAVAQFMKDAKEAGACGVGLTVSALKAHGPEALAALAADHGVFISSLNSAGYFLFSDTGKWQRQRELNTRLIEAAVRMKAGRLVVITGGILKCGLTLEAARARVAEALAALDEEAGAAGLRLALEPIHPADLTIKGCVNSVRQALDLVRPLPSTDVVLDIFHSGWDPDIWSAATLSDPKLSLVQVCDWYEPSPDEKPQRTLPGHGCMDLHRWLAALASSDYKGSIEFEIFDRHRDGRAVETILTEAFSFLRSVLP
jgi:sugar phosphate isomerase/epimerase